MVKYGIFIELAGGLKEAVLSWKERIADELGEQPYLRHPVHMTLYVSHLSHRAEWLGPLSEAIRGAGACELSCKEPYVFYDDALVLGGQTLAFRVQATPALFDLQLSVGDVLASYVDRSSLPPATLRDEPFRSSYEKYGFPFLGSHWIPHCTCASIQTARDHDLVQEFLLVPPPGPCQVTELSVWEIHDEGHQCIARLPLAA